MQARRLEGAGILIMAIFIISEPCPGWGIDGSRSSRLRRAGLVWLFRAGK